MSVWEFIILGIVLAVIREKFFGPSEADKRELEMRAQRAEDAARQRRARVDDDDEDEYEHFAEEQRRRAHEGYWRTDDGYWSTDDGYWG